MSIARNVLHCAGGSVAVVDAAAVVVSSPPPLHSRRRKHRGESSHRSNHTPGPEVGEKVKPGSSTSACCRTTDPSQGAVGAVVGDAVGRRVWAVPASGAAVGAQSAVGAGSQTHEPVEP